jgi:NAD(P)-dependent dehydrogenase (short-subunit alcohol dehydrogenase family)
MADNSAKRVLVTGGARGLGEAIVRRLAREGYAVHFTFARSGERADALRRELGSQVSAESCNLESRAAVDSLAEKLEDGPPLYGFIHNAGTTYDALAAMVEQDQGERLMQVNFWSFLRLLKAVIPLMTHARAGRIVAVGSVTAERASQGNALYAASKAALKGFVTTAAIEVARRGVTVNMIAPGYMDTDMMAPYAAKRADIERQIPARRFGKPEEVGGLVAFLLSPDAGYITGSSFTIDGGLSSAIAIQR